MIKTLGLTHLHLAVRDLRRSVAFYREVFGMENQGIADDDMVFLRTPGAADTITLRQASPGEAVGSGGGVDHFGLRLQDKADLDAADRGDHPLARLRLGVVLAASAPRPLAPPAGA